MIARPFRLLLPAAGLALAAACSIGTGLRSRPAVAMVSNPIEEFTEEDRPGTVVIELSGAGFDLELPWGYSREANGARLYPIVVNGCWGEGGYFTEAVRREYPAFFLDFNNYYTETHGALLADLLDAIGAGYRIDADRVYLTGFSQGGSGSFKLVRGMLSKGKLFAAIVRIAGQSESILADEAAEKTSLWYHIGLSDSEVRVDVARAAYGDLKARSVNATASESVSSDEVAGYARTTRTLTKDGIEVFKYSEYEGMGHSAGACYQDPVLFDWLFAQSLAIR